MDELLTRIEAATRPDREIDRDLWLAFGMYPEGIEDIGCYVDPSSGCTGGVIYSADPLTASLDAAIALCEKVLGADPAYSIQDAANHFKYAVERMNQHNGHKFFALCCDAEWTPARSGQQNPEHATGHTAPLALLAALLKAIDARANEKRVAA